MLHLKSLCCLSECFTNMTFIDGIKGEIVEYDSYDFLPRKHLGRIVFPPSHWLTKLECKLAP
jgi:hypothetical protein